METPSVPLAENASGAGAVGRIECRGISHTWSSANGNGDYHAISNVSLSIAPGEFLSIVGPSGCGKSTLLRMMAGLLQPTAGTVQIDGLKVEGPRREVGMVFQEPALFPWLNAVDNVAFGPMLTHVTPKQRRKDALEWLDKVGLSPFAKYYPFQLSGGMKQRVAIARALANGAQVLLMDEPFAALDYQARRQMQALLLALWSQFRKTVVFVTHHIDEAVLLSDRVALFSAGPAATVTETLTLTTARPRRLHDPHLQQICAEIIAHVEEQGFNGSSLVP